MAEAAIATKTARETCMDRARDRCDKAWIEGDFDSAQCLNGLCDSLESLTDEEYDSALCCSHSECECQF